MNRLNVFLLAGALLVTAGAVVTWMATGRHYYTKFEVVERVEEPVADDDPFAATGFYDGGSVETTVRRDEFHLGLFPTPQGVLDKHALSVASILGPVWGLVLGIILWQNRRRKRAA